MSTPRSTSTFPLFLGLIVVLFIGIMIYAWRGAAAADPVILDERGNVRH